MTLALVPTATTTLAVLAALVLPLITAAPALKMTVQEAKGAARENAEA